MAVTTPQKAKVVADYQRKQGDTGSPEVQIALLTARIVDLTEQRVHRQQPRFTLRVRHGHERLQCAGRLVRKV